MKESLNFALAMSLMTIGTTMIAFATVRTLQKVEAHLESKKQ